MKYVVRFILGIILTVFALVSYPILVLWTFNFKQFPFIPWWNPGSEINVFKQDGNESPFYRSYFHAIWRPNHGHILLTVKEYRDIYVKILTSCEITANQDRFEKMQRYLSRHPDSKETVEEAEERWGAF